MTTDEQRDFLKLLAELTSLVQIRNAARIQAQQAPGEDRKVWRELYKRCVIEIQSTEKEVASLLPSGEFSRRLFISFE